MHCYDTYCTVYCFCFYCVACGKPVLKCVRFFPVFVDRKSKSCARILFGITWRHVIGDWLGHQDYNDNLNEVRLLKCSCRFCLRLFLLFTDLAAWSRNFLLQYGVFMSNICSISQPMSVNLVLKLGKHMDYTLICNRVQRNILFVTWAQQQQMKNASRIFASTKIWNVSFDLLRKDCESF